MTGRHFCPRLKRTARALFYVRDLHVSFNKTPSPFVPRLKIRPLISVDETPYSAAVLDFEESVKSSSALESMGNEMIFVTLSKWRKKPTKEMIAQANKLFDQQGKEGVKILGQYWTLGRYDAVVVQEAKDEKSIMKAAVRWGDLMSTETLVAISREEAIKIVE